MTDFTLENEEDFKKSSMEKKHLIDVRKYPIRPHVGIGIVIIFDNKLCLIKRKYNPDEGKWAIPGGHLDLGEKTIDCAKREAYEETGIELEITDIAAIIDKIMYDSDGKIIYHYVLVNYNSKIIDIRFQNGIPNLKASSDALELRFVPLKEVYSYNLTDSMIELLKIMKV